MILRDDPSQRDLIRDAYLGPDVAESAERFLSSAEFDEVRSLLSDRLEDAVIVDVGAGNGIASYAFARSGAHLVYAVEPDPSGEIGRGAIASLCRGLPVEVLDAVGEAIPLADASADVVYARQVLHHARDLPRFVLECARVLKPGGLLVACREHVVDNEQQLAQFLASHPVHLLTGGEYAYTLRGYETALRTAGLQVEAVYGPWDTVINAFPFARSREELARCVRARLHRRLGPAAELVRFMPWLERLARGQIDRSAPGRPYSFLARRV